MEKPLVELPASLPVLDPAIDPAILQMAIVAEIDTQSAVEPQITTFNEAPVAPSEKRERFWRSRAGRLVTKLGAIAGLATAGIVAAPAPASADVVAVQHVHNTGGEGLWLHPDSSDRHSPTSDLMPDGTEFDVDCHTTGSNVEGDTAWLHGTNRATGDSGYAADFYIDTDVHQGNEDAELSQLGIPVCGEDNQQQTPATPNLQPAAPVKPFVPLDRNKAAQWALDHAEDTPPNDGSCTIFASEDLWNAGVPETSQWNDNLNLIKYGWRNGSRDAWAAENYIDFMRTQPYVQIEPLGQMSPTNNNIPDARLGDQIGYDWDNNGSIDHIDVITGFSGQYALVSGWSEDGAAALDYDQRGWTYSKLHSTWLQLEKDSGGNYTQFNMAAYLIHFQSEQDLNITN